MRRVALDFAAADDGVGVGLGHEAHDQALLVFGDEARIESA